MNKLPIEIIDKIISFVYHPSYCVLEDCNRPSCHNCFPVTNCLEHEKCINYGQFVEYKDYVVSEIIKEKIAKYDDINYTKSKKCLKCK